MKILIDKSLIATKAREVIPGILTSLPDLNLMSPKALTDLYLILLDLSCEAAEVEKDEIRGEGKEQNVKRRGLDRYVLHLKQWRKQEIPKEHSQLLGFLYDKILQMENMGTLPGFGFANYDSNEGRRKIKGGSLLNPEKSSIYQSQ